MAYDLTDIVTTKHLKKLAQRVENKLNNIDVTGNLTHETLTFELEDGTTVNKEIVLWQLLSPPPP